MGIVRTGMNQRLEELEEFKRALLACGGGGFGRRKGGEGDRKMLSAAAEGEGESEEKVVAVTSGASYLGLAIVNRLLLRGYSVRVIVYNEEDKEKIRAVTGGGASNNVSGVVANLRQVESLLEAFDGCCAVLHTSAFIDPAGLRGYTKFMADFEVKASENVMEACARTPSIRNCVLTSSLLACIWRHGSPGNLSHVVNHNCWSHESLCLDNKLWYALGKLRAEEAAWRIARERGLRLITICPGLITGPDFCHRNPTATLAYLKGGGEMYAKGLLATIDVSRVAEVHERLLEAMEMGRASGRYICYDRVIEGEDEAEELAQMAGMPKDKITGSEHSRIRSTRFKLSKTKLEGLMTTPSRCKFAA